MTLIHGDCLTVLPTLADASVDAVITDPPYPCIKRSYGYWTEAEWFSLMDVVVPQCRRVLKPSGSAVFVLQPNSERLGRMRTWLWEFMVKWGREWGIVQDAYWHNPNTPPQAQSIQGQMMRPSLKTCVWMGAPACYRAQDAVLRPISSRHASFIRQYATQESSPDKHFPSGQKMNYARAAKSAAVRGGTSPFNLVEANHGAGQDSAGAHGHGAGTPSKLCEWWLRYICPPDGTVLDPFMGSGTVALAAEKLGRNWIGIERESEYVAIAEHRIAEARVRSAAPLFTEAPA